MKVGLIDVDGHRFPNLALMRISAYHRAHGDSVEWYEGLLTGHCDRVYMSKVFSFSPDYEYCIDADEVLRGGSGYAISLIDGRERYDRSKDGVLPEEIERCFPDYSIYPQYEYAVSMTSRGCPRGCAFCHVAAKEGRGTVKVADVTDFYSGQKSIKVLDANITACHEKRELFRQYIETGAVIDFSQGLDLRLIDEGDIEDLNKMRTKVIHFAWDNPDEDLESKFEEFAKRYKRKTNIATVYVLVNYESTLEQDLHRIYTLRDLGYDPFVMVYDKEHAPLRAKKLMRWCNNKWVFSKVNRFEDYVVR